jgi:hypothetical protein
MSDPPFDTLVGQELDMVSFVRDYVELRVDYSIVADDLERDALGEQQGGGGVAEFVCVPVTEPGGSRVFTEVVADVGAVERCAESGAEDEVGAER